MSQTEQMLADGRIFSKCSRIKNLVRSRMLFIKKNQKDIMSSSLQPPCITAYVIHLSGNGPRYLLIRRSCGGYLNGTWQMVTGGIMEGETAIQTAFREIEEETGCTPTKLYSADAVETFYLHAQNKIVLVPVFVAFTDSMNVTLCPEEHNAYEWLPFEEAQQRLVWAEQKRIIAHIHVSFCQTEPNRMLLLEKPAIYEK
jgi:dihydroneopterin triphosphate diphosphatase